MAIILVRNVDNVLPIGTSIEADRAASYKRGDIVNVYPDDYVFGSRMGLPGFVRIRITGIPAPALSEVMAYRASHDVGEQTIIRRRYSIPLTVCDAAELAGGELVTNWGSLRSQIVDKTA